MSAMRGIAALRWVLVVLVALVAAWSIWRFSLGHDGAASVGARAGEPRYYCPMHPEVRAHDPGQCPICHMNLEPIARDTPPAASDAGAAMAPDDAQTAPPGEVMLSLDRVQRAGVASEVATRTQATTTLRATAVVEATEGAVSEVHVRTAGFVERVAVRETAARVSRGEALCWVYAPQVYQVQLELLAALRWGAAEAADAGHIMGAAEAARASLGLLGMSREDIDTVERTRTPVRAVAVRATAGGVVTRRGAVLGMYATPETVLYEVTDLSRVWAVAAVHPQDLPYFTVGTRARFEAPGLTREARVVRVEPTVQAETRTTRVRLAIDNHDGALRVGAFGAVTLDGISRTSVTVARDAVVDTGRARYVFIDHGGGRFEGRAVTLGRELDDRWEVLDGVAPGERVVVRGGFLLDSESRLNATLRGVPAGSMGDAGRSP